MKFNNTEQDTWHREGSQSMLLLLLCPHLSLIRTTHTVCAENVTCTRHCSCGGRDHTDGKTLGPRAAALHVLIRSPFPASSHALYSVPYMVDLSELDQQVFLPLDSGQDWPMGSTGKRLESGDAVGEFISLAPSFRSGWGPSTSFSRESQLSLDWFPGSVPSP